MISEERPLDPKETADMKTLMRFVGIYCREHHGGEKASFSMRLLKVEAIAGEDLLLCPDCTKLLRYGLSMRLKCPHNPKPMCKKCETQCYRGEYKEKIRDIMKFSGMYLVKHGRVDLLYHYFR
jgi:hypothetical protein